jgi:hypothetical protein
MRLYKKLKPLGSGQTAGINNKGVLICNTETLSGEVVLEVINCDNTIAGLTLTIGAATPGLGSHLTPNYFLFPFTVKRWTEIGGFAMNGYELY